MSFFKKTNAKIFAKPAQRVTPDTIYWKKLGAPVLLKEFGAIDYIDFSPIEPHFFAVSCSARVQVYNPITKSVHKTLSKFYQGAYGGSYRCDGELLCSGSEEGDVKVFLVDSKSLLRVFKGHNGPVHRAFFTCDKQKVASFSDDKTVRLWDVGSSTSLMEFTSHEDYVRAGAVSRVSSNIVISGSYDKTVKMYDARSGTEPVFSVEHGSPVESVIFLPSSSVFISAGGTEIKVWDALAGGRLLARIWQHHKTVTCLGLASSGTRLLSGSLDRHVKVYDVASYKPVHNFDFPNSILSLGVSPNDETLAVGMVDGMISVQKRETEEEEEQSVVVRRKKRETYRYYSDKYIPDSSRVDLVVKYNTKQATAKYDTCLRKFQYSKALDTVLTAYTSTKTPHVTVALLQELIRRKGLENAIVNRPEKSISLLLKFLIKHIGEPRFASTLIDVSNILLDVYEKKLDTASAENLELLKKLKKRLDEEEQQTLDLASLGGAIRMLLAASSEGGRSSPIPPSNISTNKPQPAIPLTEQNQQKVIANHA